MNKQHSNEMGSIRKKLLAAVAMLLVACVMTVSSTYAWFTLSTAPEVKGITTTVGANGNLEIALDDGIGQPAGSAEGDSMDKAGQTKVNANKTWGNLIDLSDESYGLDKITLYPTRLNATTGQMTSTVAPLSYAKYGSDGRITALDPNTLLGKWNANANGFMANGDGTNTTGVNAIGSASSMSPREFAVINNKKAIDSNRVAAAAEAKGAINLYSGTLAALAIENQESADDVVIDDTSIQALENLIAKLQSSNAYIGDSIKSAIMLWLASDESALEDTAWESAVDNFEDKGVNEIIDTFTSVTGLAVLPDKIQDPINDYNAIDTKLTTAMTNLTAAKSAGNKWVEVKKVVTPLLNYSDILICGETISAIKASKDAGETDGAFQKVVDAVMDGGLKFTFSDESGIFADIAKMTGAYSSTMVFPDGGITVEGIKIKKPVPVDVESPSTNTVSGELGIIYAYVVDQNWSYTNTGSGSAQKALTDTYGYTVDLLFRTNASDSYLQLQTIGANRIYAGNDKNADLQGEGSNMTFTINEEYTKDKIDDIAAGIRVVFYNTETGEIYGVATLDTSKSNITDDKYKLDLVLVDYEIVNGIMTPGVARDDVKLTALTANTITRVTALVYLDGDVIGNDEIGIASELDGKLNLQFSSSAALTPMDNNDLKNGTTK